MFAIPLNCVILSSNCEINSKRIMMMVTKRTSRLIMMVATVLLFIVSCKNGAAPEKSDTVTEEESNRDLFSMDRLVTPSNETALEEDLSGELIVITEEEFVQRITNIDNPKGYQYKGETPCVIDFYADWCGPCIRLNPLLVELAKEYQGKVIFYKINTDKAPNVTRKLEVNYLPTLCFFKRNAIPNRIEGAPLKEDLKKAIDEILLSENR